MTALIWLLAILGVLVFFSNIGWGVTLALVARNHLREANAFDVEERISARIDDRVSAVLERARRLKERREGPEGLGSKPQTVLDDRAELERERQRQAFLGEIPEAKDEGMVEALLNDMPIEGG